MPIPIARRRSPGKSRITAPLAAGGALLILLLTACQEVRTSGFQRRMPPKPRQTQPAPDGARTDAVVLNVAAAPLDTDGNGYADLIPVTAHLFDTRYPAPIREAGAFVFTLFLRGGSSAPEPRPFRQWRIDGAILQAAEGRSAFGVCYHFELSLLDRGDVLPVVGADLVCAFEPDDGRPPVSPREVSTIQLGRRVAMPALAQPEAEPATPGGG